MTDCLFCRLIAGEVPATFVFQDERLVAFTDINPQAPTHILIVARQHVGSLNELTPEHDGLVGEIIRRAAAIAKERHISEDGYRTVFNCNRAAGQTVFHVHLHLLGGRPFTWPPG